MPLRSPNSFKWNVYKTAPSERLRLRGGRVFKAHGLFYHSTLGSRVMKQRGKRLGALPGTNPSWAPAYEPRGNTLQGAKDLYLKAKPGLVNFRGIRGQFKNNYFTEMCSDSEAGFVSKAHRLSYHSTLDLRITKKAKRMREPSLVKRRARIYSRRPITLHP